MVRPPRPPGCTPLAQAATNPDLDRTTSPSPCCRPFHPCCTTCTCLSPCSPPSSPHRCRYDEPQLLKEVERRLGTPLQTLAQFVAAGGDVKQQLAKYGQAKDGGLNEASSERLHSLAPAVTELAALERRAQHSFLLGIRESLQRPPTGGAAATAPAEAPQAMEAAPTGSGGHGGGGGAGRLNDGGGGGGSSSPSLRGGGGRGGGGGGGRNKRGRR